MEFTGKIIAILQPRGGVAKSGNEWKAQEYVIEDHGQYPRKMCFDVFGADKIEQFNIQMGEGNAKKEVRKFFCPRFSSAFRISGWNIITMAVIATLNVFFAIQMIVFI